MALLIENIYKSYWRSSFSYPTDVGASVGFFLFHIVNFLTNVIEICIIKFYSNWIIIL
nr:MAG TPA: hypothetical protein [Caudoviricetes sp.]